MPVEQCQSHAQSHGSWEGSQLQRTGSPGRQGAKQKAQEAGLCPQLARTLSRQRCWSWAAAVSCVPSERLQRSGVDGSWRPTNGMPGGGVGQCAVLQAATVTVIDSN